MGDIVLLQLIGLCATVISLGVAFWCWLFWRDLPDNRKVWAMAIWIMYCGMLSIGSMLAFGGAFELP